ncbi:hypothetical protein PN499_08400 [Kamptonema animale CS-326]|uniref:hypothetical protein n=1 Tax=Kamptonema animale TaxID=92934 RepID=UPI00232E92BE|nr:hypothetical protein [Kamptonema animale]MDB9511200.1 hypothetical protein [Kamptonema animale CS-326]
MWEFKELSAEAVNIGNAFQRGVAIAKKRAPNLGYHIRQLSLKRLIKDWLER